MAGTPASPLTRTGPPMQRGAISRSTRFFSIPTARSMIRSAAWPICGRAGFALSATPPLESPRMCCGCCAITGSRRGSGRAAAIRQARAACRAAAHRCRPVGRAHRAGAHQAAREPATRWPRCEMMQEDGVLAVDPAGGAPARPPAAYDRDRAGSRSAAPPGRADRRRCRRCCRCGGPVALLECVARSAPGARCALAARPAGRTTVRSGAPSTGSAPSRLPRSPSAARPRKAS